MSYSHLGVLSGIHKDHITVFASHKHVAKNGIGYVPDERDA
jgi:hypothetical protein